MESHWQRREASKAIRFNDASQGPKVRQGPGSLPHLPHTIRCPASFKPADVTNNPLKAPSIRYYTVYRVISKPDLETLAPLGHANRANPQVSEATCSVYQASITSIPSTPLLDDSSNDVRSRSTATPPAEAGHFVRMTYMLWMSLLRPPIASPPRSTSC